MEQVSNFINFFAALSALSSRFTKLRSRRSCWCRKHSSFRTKIHTEKLFDELILIVRMPICLHSLPINKEALYFSMRVLNSIMVSPSWDEVALVVLLFRKSKPKDTEGARYRYVNTYMSSSGFFTLHDTSKTKENQAKGSINDNRVLERSIEGTWLYIYFIYKKRLLEILGKI